MASSFSFPLRPLAPVAITNFAVFRVLCLESCVAQRGRFGRLFLFIVPLSSSGMRNEMHVFWEGLDCAELELGRYKGPRAFFNVA